MRHTATLPVISYNRVVQPATRRSKAWQTGLFSLQSRMNKLSSNSLRVTSSVKSIRYAYAYFSSSKLIYELETLMRASPDSSPAINIRFLSSDIEFASTKNHMCCSQFHSVIYIMPAVKTVTHSAVRPYLKTSPLYTTAIAMFKPSFS